MQVMDLGRFSNRPKLRLEWCGVKHGWKLRFAAKEHPQRVSRGYRPQGRIVGCQARGNSCSHWWEWCRKVHSDQNLLWRCCSTSGKIVINGKVFSSMTPQLAAENGIAIIYQEFSSVRELSVPRTYFSAIPFEEVSWLTRRPWRERQKKLLPS